VIDLDERVFEVHTGFNTEPLSPHDRFAFLESSIRKPCVSGAVYHPVRLKMAYGLGTLPSDEFFLIDAVGEV
jgi:hypothetical protein